MNIFTAAYEGMAIAAKEVADKHNLECTIGVVDDAVCQCCNSQAALPYVNLCDFCITIVEDKCEHCNYQDCPPCPLDE